MDRPGDLLPFGVNLAIDRVAALYISSTSGGGGNAQDLAAALSDEPSGGHAQAALAASIFHFGETTVGQVKAALLEMGIAVRPPSPDGDGVPGTSPGSGGC